MDLRFLKGKILVLYQLPAHLYSLFYDILRTIPGTMDETELALLYTGYGKFCLFFQCRRLFLTRPPFLI